MIVTHKINMNLDRAGVMPRVDVVQGDANTREIQFCLFSGGQVWTVPSDVRILIRYRKPTGAGGTYDTMSDGTAAAVVFGNTVTVTLAPQALSSAGSVSLAVTLAKGDAELSTFAVQLNVMKNPTAATDDDGNYVSVAGMIPLATSASVGQYVAVAATDPSGTVTKLKAVTPIAGGQPIPVSSSADMTDPEKIYLYSGSESGFKKGHWYYNANGSWVDGGLYGESDVTSDDVPVNADIDDTNMVSFRNAAGITLFTLDLAGLSSGDVYFGNVVISAERLEVAEGGTGTFTVCLETAPSVNQPVYLAVSDATRLSISPSTLTFTPDNYATEQTVTVTALQDEDEDDDSVTVTLTSRKVDARQVVVAIGDDDKPVITQDGLALYFNYRGHADDTSATITDEVHGVTASNFDAFLKHDNGIYGQQQYKYLTLTLTDEPGLAFKEMMKNSDGFTVESFGTMFAPSFFMPNYRSLISPGGAHGLGLGAHGYPKDIFSIAPTRILSDGTSDYSKISIDPVFTINGTEYRPVHDNAIWTNMPYYDSFYHIVVTYSNDGKICYWCNGIRFGESDAIPDFASWDMDAMLAAMSMINNYSGSEETYTSSHRVYNRVLTEDEIKMNMRVEAANMGISTF